MRCKPCGAPRNPSADRCDYCQSWHEAKRYDYGRMTAPQHQASLLQAQMAAQMMAQDAAYQAQRSYLSGMANAYGGAGSGLFGLLGRLG